MNKYKRTLITTALPYANGPIHIGHLAGVYVPADIYARYLRLKNEEVLLIGGSDEHGVPITLKAKNEGITPQDVVDKFHGIIKNRFRNLVFRLMFIRVPVQKFITKQLLSFSKNCTTTESLSKKLRSNITTRRTNNFWPTVILPESAPNVDSKKRMATSAKVAELRLAQMS